MGVFKDVFEKTFLGIKGDQPFDDGTAAALDEGFIMTSGISTRELQNSGAPYSLGIGTFGMFSQSTWQSMVIADLEDNNCCPLVLASASVLSADKIGKFHGGYQESTKSKYIVPRRISRFYRVDPCTPQQAIVHVGNTNYTSTLSPSDSACCKEFYCDETYYLRLDLKGSPVLRSLHRNNYITVSAYGGCCDGPTPTVIDSTLIFIQWAKEIYEHPLFKDFVLPVVFDESGNPWFVSSEEAVSAGWPATQTIYDYVSPGHSDGDCAGMRLLGAFVETKFENCTFQPLDHYEVEPLRIYASEVDLTGNPCQFEGLCVHTECEGLQGMGFGEAAVRELIMSESYLSNKLHTDLRIREITLGDDILNALNRTSFYTSYYIQHSVPQRANNSQTYDEQQYLLEIKTGGISAGFEAFMASWLNSCGDCTSLETFDCTPCTPADIPTP